MCVDVCIYVEYSEGKATNELLRHYTYLEPVLGCSECNFFPQIYDKLQI